MLQRCSGEFNTRDPGKSNQTGSERCVQAEAIEGWAFASLGGGACWLWGRDLPGGGHYPHGDAKNPAARRRAACRTKTGVSRRGSGRHPWSGTITGGASTASTTSPSTAALRHGHHGATAEDSRPGGPLQGGRGHPNEGCSFFHDLLPAVCQPQRAGPRQRRQPGRHAGPGAVLAVLCGRLLCRVGGGCGCDAPGCHKDPSANVTKRRRRRHVQRNHGLHTTHPGARRPVRIPEGGNVPRFGHRSSLWHRAGRLLPWGGRNRHGHFRIASKMNTLHRINPDVYTRIIKAKTILERFFTKKKKISLGSHTETDRILVKRKKLFHACDSSEGAVFEQNARASSFPMRDLTFSGCNEELQHVERGQT